MIKENYEISDDREFVPTERCVSCGCVLPADEMLIISNDALCPDCAEDAEVYRCGWCGYVFERQDFCPECGHGRKE